MSKIIHLPNGFLPYQTGGKEVFVKCLMERQMEKGHQVLAVFHQTSKNEPIGKYKYQNIDVEVLPALDNPNYIQWLKGEVNSLSGFKELINKWHPDCVHFHDQSYGASLTHLLFVKSQNIKTVVTYHSPGQSCPQHNLLYKNEKICDGKLLVNRCTDCRIFSLGLPSFLSKFSAMTELPLFPELSKADKLFRARHYTKIFIEGFFQFYQNVDEIQVHAQWVKDILTRNGINQNKIQEVDMSEILNISHFPKTKKILLEKPLKIVFIGRCKWIKGTHLLINSIQKLDKIKYPVEVFFFGPYFDNSIYGNKLKTKIKNDPRFHYPKLIPNEKLMTELQKMDVCVIPSLWPETGPITYYDAKRAGLKVIASDKAGLKEKLQTEDLYFFHGDSNDLATKIKSLFFSYSNSV